MNANMFDDEETLTRCLARLAIETPTNALPPTALDAAKRLMLDSLACAIAAVEQPGCHETAAWVEQTGGRPETSLAGFGGKAPLAQAAFVNSLLTHALDYDDIFSLASLHVSSILFPCSLCAGEAWDAGGRDVLAAYSFGAEVACQLGLAAVARRSGPGFLPTTIEGGFGGVAALCRLRGMTVEQTARAMGLYYAQAAGNRQALVEMTTAKRLQPAFAVRDAVWATELAARGVSGSQRALEGEFGLFRTYYKNEPPPIEAMTRSADEPWRIEQISTKPYTSCGACHSLVDAALRLSKKHTLDPERVKRVEISWGGSGTNAMVDRPFRCEPEPQISAQFSAPYCVALALLRQTQDLCRFTNEAIRADREVIAFSRKVRGADRRPPPQRLPTPDHFPDWYGDPHTVRVVLQDGTIIEESRAPAQTRAPEANGWDQTIEKWRSCVDFSDILPDEAKERIPQTVADLETADNLAPLMRLLTTNSTISD